MSSFNVSSIAKSQQWRNDLLMKPSDSVPKPNNEVFNEPPQLKYPGHPGHPGHLGHPGPQGYQGHLGLASHPVPPGHLVQPGRPSYSGHGHACQSGHASHAGQAGQPGRQMLTNASVCCEQPNCNRAKIEQMPEHYFQEPATPFTLMNPGQRRDPQSGKKQPSAPPSDHDYMYFPCRQGGQLVTICCTGRNCDNATKIDEIIHMGPPDVHMRPPDVHMRAPDVHMRAPDVHMRAPDVHMRAPDVQLGSPGPSEKKRVRTSYNQYKY